MGRRAESKKKGDDQRLGQHSAPATCSKLNQELQVQERSPRCGDPALCPPHLKNGNMRGPENLTDSLRFR